MQIEIPFAKIADSSDMLSVSAFLDTLTRNNINISPWPGFDYHPDVSFTIAYTDDSILLKYYVKETSFRLLYRSPNDPVYKDSCVEFFIDLNNNGYYYNFEFNAIGTCLSGYGKDRFERKQVPASVIEQIKTQSVISAESLETGQSIYWELALVIPFKNFIYDDITSLKNKSCRVNFYKCGDDTPQPHYLAWNNIGSEIPNFHLPEFFGKASFI